MDDLGCGSIHDGDKSLTSTIRIGDKIVTITARNEFLLVEAFTLDLTGNGRLEPEPYFWESYRNVLWTPLKAFSHNDELKLWRSRAESHVYHANFASHC